MRFACFGLGPEQDPVLRPTMDRPANVQIFHLRASRMLAIDAGFRAVGASRKAFYLLPRDGRAEDKGVVQRVNLRALHRQTQCDAHDYRTGRPSSKDWLVFGGEAQKGAPSSS